MAQLQFVTLVLASTVCAAATSLELADLTPALVRGHVLLLRHADAPGGGDPNSFNVDDCSTQRNLGSSGKAQATRIGSDLRFLNLNFSRVLTSKWCRCIDTATLMNVGPTVQQVDMLGSFYQAWPIGVPKDATVAALRKYLASEVDPCAPPQLMVSHKVTVSEIGGVGVLSGYGVLYNPFTGTSRQLNTAPLDRAQQPTAENYVPCPADATTLPRTTNRGTASDLRAASTADTTIHATTSGTHGGNTTVSCPAGSCSGTQASSMGVGSTSGGVRAAASTVASTGGSSASSGTSATGTPATTGTSARGCTPCSNNVTTSIPDAGAGVLHSCTWLAWAGIGGLVLLNVAVI